MGYSPLPSEKKPDASDIAKLNKLLVKAVGHGDYVAIEEALRLGADIDHHIEYSSYTSGGTLMYHAIDLQDPYFFDLAVKYGADANKGASKTSPLRIAVYKGSLGFCQRIVELDGFDISDPLNRAAFSLAESKQSENLRHGQIYRFLKRVFEGGNGWEKSSDETVEYTEINADYTVEIKEVFNFRAAQMTRVTRDYATAHTDIAHRYFSEIPREGRGRLHEAFEELQKQGGGAGIDPGSFSQPHVTRYNKRDR